MYYDDISYYDDMHVRDVMLYYDEEFQTHNLNDIIDDKCMKVCACMLLRSNM